MGKKIPLKRYSIASVREKFPSPNYEVPPSSGLSGGLVSAFEVHKPPPGGSLKRRESFTAFLEPGVSDKKESWNPQQFLRPQLRTEIQSNLAIAIMDNINGNADAPVWKSIQKISKKVHDHMKPILENYENLPQNTHVLLRQFDTWSAETRELLLNYHNSVSSSEGSREESLKGLSDHYQRILEGNQFSKKPQKLPDNIEGAHKVLQAYSENKESHDIYEFWSRLPGKIEGSLSQQSEYLLGEQHLQAADHLYLHANFVEGILPQHIDRYADQIARHKGLEGTPSREELLGGLDSNLQGYLIAEGQEGNAKPRKNLFQQKGFDWSKTKTRRYGILGEGQEYTDNLSFRKTSEDETHFLGGNLYQPTMNNEFNREAVRSGIPLVSAFSDTTQKQMKAAIYLGELSGEELEQYKTLLIANMAHQGGHSFEETALAVNTYGEDRFQTDNILSAIHLSYRGGETGRDLDTVLKHYEENSEANYYLFPDKDSESKPIKDKTLLRFRLGQQDKSDEK